jgi:hypothetical protein
LIISKKILEQGFGQETTCLLLFMVISRRPCPPPHAPEEEDVKGNQSGEN